MDDGFPFKIDIYSDGRCLGMAEFRTAEEARPAMERWLARGTIMVPLTDKAHVLLEEVSS